MQIKLAKISSIADPKAAVYVAYDLSQVRKVCELLGTENTVWSREQLNTLGARAGKGEFDMLDIGYEVTITLKEAAADPLPEVFKEHPEAVMALFKVQATYRQRERDKDKPKAELRITGVTRERAQQIADDLCQHIYWGDAYVAPAVNA